MSEHVHIRCRDPRTVKLWREMLWEFKKKGWTAEQLLYRALKCLREHYVERRFY